VRRVELEEVEVPHDFSTVGVDDRLVIGRIDESNRKRVRANAKIPAGKGSVPVCGRVPRSINIEGIRVSRGGVRQDLLVDGLPKTTNLLRRESRPALLPVAAAVIGISGDVGNEQGRWKRTSTSGLTNGLDAKSGRTVAIDVCHRIMAVEVPCTHLE